MSQEHATPTFADALVALLEVSRRAERDVIGSLPRAVIDAPMAGEEWSPKDTQAHLNGWKARQATRFAAAREGRAFERVEEAEIQAYNAELAATRRDWSWEEIEREADQVHDELVRAVLDHDPAALAADPDLYGGVFGNGPYHTLEHAGYVARACGGAERVADFARELAQMATRGGLPDAEAGALLYNVACNHALAGRLDESRRLLPTAFNLRPDLREWAPQDSDLTALRDELDALMGQ